MVVDPCVRLNEYELACVGHSQQACIHVLLLKSVGGWELLRHPRKNRNPTSMPNLVTVCCLQVEHLCEIDSRLMGTDPEQTSSARSRMHWVKGCDADAQQFTNTLFFPSLQPD